MEVEYATIVTFERTTMPSVVNDSGIIFVLIINIVVFLLALLFFCSCKHRYKYYFYPQAGRVKSKLYPTPEYIAKVTKTLSQSSDDTNSNIYGLPAGAVPPTATVDGIFNWIKTIVTYSEKDIQQSHAIGMLVLLPTNYSGTNGMSGFNATCLGNLHEEDPRLWIHLCAVYLFTGFTVVLVYRAFNSHVDMYHKYRTLPLPSNYTTFVKKIPTHVRTSKKLQEHFEKFFPGQVVGAHLVFDTTEIDKMISEREDHKNNLHTAQHQFKLTGNKPMHSVEKFGNQEVDSIDYHTREIQRLRLEIAAEQAKVDVDGQTEYQPLPVGFVTLNSLLAANMCAQAAHSMTKWNVKVAPTISDINWDLLRVSRVNAWSRRFLVFGITVILIVFWSIPVSVISQFSSITYLEKFDALRPIVHWIYALPDTVISFVVRFLPTVVLLAVMLLLVPIIRLMVQQEKHDTKSAHDISVFRKYSAFLILNVLLLSTIFSQLGAIITAAADNPSAALVEVARMLGKTLPTFGGFFINYFLNSAFAAGALSMSRIVFFLVHFIQLKVAKSPKQRAEVRRDAVGPFEYDVQYALHLTVLTVAMAYSSMVPLILPVAVAYFVVWYFVDKYNLMFVNYEYYDAQGKWAGPVYRRVLISLIIYHFAMFGIFLVKGVFLPGALVLPLFAFDFYLIWYSNKTVLYSKYVPMEAAAEVQVTATDLGFPFKYLAPALRAHPSSSDADALRGSVVDFMSTPATPSTGNVHDSIDRDFPIREVSDSTEVSRDLVQLDEFDDEDDLRISSNSINTPPSRSSTGKLLSEDDV